MFLALRSDDVAEFLPKFDSYCDAIQSPSLNEDYPCSEHVDLREHEVELLVWPHFVVSEWLAKNGRVGASVFLLERLLNRIEQLGEESVISNDEKADLNIALGSNYVRLRRYSDGSKSLKVALGKGQHCASLLQNLIICLGMEGDLEGIREIEELLTQRERYHSEEFSDVYYNMGTFVARYEGEFKKSSSDYFRLALKLDGNNYSARLFLARNYALRSEFVQALELFHDGDQQFGTLPNDLESQIRFYYLFSYSCMLAIAGQFDKAEEISRTVGKTKVSKIATTDLKAYIEALRKSRESANAEEVRTQIVEALKKFEFSYSVGRLIDQHSLFFPTDEIIGYHGTVKVYQESLQEKIMPMKGSLVRQFNGKGFYVTKDLEAAMHFATLKQWELGGGEPIVIEIVANRNIVGKLGHRGKVKESKLQPYDFFRAAIEGMEVYSQYVFFERSLCKIQAGDVKEVDWVEWDPDAFEKKFRRGGC